VDPVIENLPSTTFEGRRFTHQQIADIQKTVQTFPKLSRRELGHTLCEHLNWFTPGGQTRVQACLNLLDELEAGGVIRLPAKHTAQIRGPQKPLAWTDATAAAAPIAEELKQLAPIQLQVVTEKAAVRQWNESVDRHHYLGYRRPMGPHLRYDILDQHQRRLGCLLFAFAVQSLPCREQWIGWSDTARRTHLHRVVNNQRFLIFPWVSVKCLASKALALAARQLPRDWETHHGYRPVLLETFVDPDRFSGTSYQAANWIQIGHSQGRGHPDRPATYQSAKAVWVYPLSRQFRHQLGA
jgi:hypothetical protein